LSGNLITANTILSSVQEKISTSVIAVSGGATTLVYNTGGEGTIYQVSGAFSSNYTLNITNLPSMSDTTKTYVVSVINNTASTAGYVCSAVTLSTTSTPGSAAKLLFSGGNSYVYSSNIQYSTQQFAIIYHSTGGVYVLSTYNAFYTP
jgi:hypothetical protein